MTKFVVLVFAVLVSLCQVQAMGVSCWNCADVQKPYYCRNIINCGTKDYCSTEEYTTDKGLPAFRLSCAAQERCNLLTNGNILFGRREVPHPTPSKCYECCSTHLCNAELCQGGNTSAAAVTT